MSRSTARRTKPTTSFTGAPITPSILPVPRAGPAGARRRALRSAANVLRELGAAVREVSAPWREDPTALFFTCVAADGGAQLRSDLAPAAGRHHRLMTELMAAVSEQTLTAAQWFSAQSRLY